MCTKEAVKQPTGCYTPRLVCNYLDTLSLLNSIWALAFANWGLLCVNNTGRRTKWKISLVRVHSTLKFSRFSSSYRGAKEMGCENK